MNWRQFRNLDKFNGKYGDQETQYPADFLEGCQRTHLRHSMRPEAEVARVPGISTLLRRSDHSMAIPRAPKRDTIEVFGTRLSFTVLMKSFGSMVGLGISNVSGGMTTNGRAKGGQMNSNNTFSLVDARYAKSPTN
ncbi:hypothetical protein GALMADRAFT_251965 [Galerina marginata CBS 339.88]|uniref:Uncharacterized protein n=1 Tax=Galerina marginata (strain CBS 339.88) TaxID=685588 RepID=A0A067STE4_GALM3|nr:hypothetical protein GALMADRAFT_251965 [Galerina marginata CBS 339.88]